MLCDTGPLVALVDEHDARHLDCKNLIPRLTRPLLSTWPCFSEAMYLIGRRHGIKHQIKLWELAVNGALKFHLFADHDFLRIRDLMIKYQNVPMDFADASLVAVAEALNQTRIFTLDSDFRIYRIHDRTPFDIVP